VSRRVLLKLSGEALSGTNGYTVDPEKCLHLAEQLKRLQEAGVQIGVVIGGGNIFRGSQGVALGMARVPADHIGMLATVINGISLQQTLHQIGASARIMSALGPTEVVEALDWKRSLRLLDQGTIVVFAGGTGNPYFTTDTNAALRAAQIQAEVLLKGTKVDGVYDKDPLKYSDAIRFDRLSYQKALELGVEVMDQTAISMCRENQIPIKVFSLSSLWEGVMDETYGTLVS
jgi:uridylate kinase